MQIRSVVRRGWTAAVVAAAVGSGVLVVAQGQQGALPLDPSRERGSSVTPAYEGWYENSDGTFSMLLGYYNRNAKQTFDIPIGPNNKIEPGNVDQGQPTYFEVGRQWGVVAVRVPKDFGTKKLTWTITSNGETQSIPFTLNKAYNIAPLKEIGMGNTPPVLTFAQGGPKFTGPPVGIATTFTGTVNEPVTLSVWAADAKATESEGGRGRGSASVASVSLHKYRGPGTVTFEKTRLSAAKQDDMVSTTAKFSAPGEYIIRVQANDESGEGGNGFQCSWTNTHLKVTIQ